MRQPITEKTIRQFIEHIGHQDHAMAGAVISATAAQAVALGKACLQISLEQRGNALDSQAVNWRIEQMTQIQEVLAGWCDRDAVAIAEFVALRKAGQELKGQQLLCDAPAEMSRLSLRAAVLLQGFRPLVAERVQDDLEMSLTLLAAAAQAAMLLLDSNLRIWPEEALLAHYEPIRIKLETQIRQLTPVARVRS
jgi:formiminotetrahydrofolate cyclodeaminase